MVKDKEQEVHGTARTVITQIVNEEKKKWVISECAGFPPDHPYRILTVFSRFKNFNPNKLTVGDEIVVDFTTVEESRNGKTRKSRYGVNVLSVFKTNLKKENK